MDVFSITRGAYATTTTHETCLRLNFRFAFSGRRSTDSQESRDDGPGDPLEDGEENSKGGLSSGCNCNEQRRGYEGVIIDPAARVGSRFSVPSYFRGTTSVVNVTECSVMRLFAKPPMDGRIKLKTVIKAVMFSPFFFSPPHVSEWR